MQAIKASFDPNGILNPGKVLPVAVQHPPAAYRLGVDIGGTFTDVVLPRRRRLRAHGEGAVDAGRLRARRRRRCLALLAECGVTGDRGRRRRPRLDGRLEHGARGPRREHGARDDEGLPRRARDAPAADPRALRHPVPEPAAARSPAAADTKSRSASGRAARRGRSSTRRPCATSPSSSAGTTSRRSRSRCSTRTPTTRTSAASRRSSARLSATAST